MAAPARAACPRARPRADPRRPFAAGMEDWMPLAKCRSVFGFGEDDESSSDEEIDYEEMIDGTHSRSELGASARCPLARMYVFSPPNRTFARTRNGSRRDPGMPRGSRNRG